MSTHVTQSRHLGLNIANASSGTMLEPGIGRHHGFGHDCARINQVDAVPGIRVLATNSMQVRASSLGAPQEGTVVGKLVRTGVGPIALYFRDQRSDLLRVTNTATLADIDISTGQFHRVIRTDVLGGSGQ